MDKKKRDRAIRAIREGGSFLVDGKPIRRLQDLPGFDAENEGPAAEAEERSLRYSRDELRSEIDSLRATHESLGLTHESLVAEVEALRSEKSRLQHEVASLEEMATDPFAAAGAAVAIDPETPPVEGAPADAPADESEPKGKRKSK